MDKYIPLHNLGTVDKFRQARAFSLAELVVSIGVLSLMVLLAGQVMTLTVKSTGQATALTNTVQRLRVFEQTLREDLRYVNPGRSVMVIQGNPINAYWTQAGKDVDADGNPSTGYPHVADPERNDPFIAAQLVKPRADMLMFFTARPGTSYRDPRVHSQLQQIVIGHARLGEYLPDTMNSDIDNDGGPFSFSLATAADPFAALTGVFPTPAESWHLARRAVLLMAPPQIDSTWPKGLHAVNPNAVAYADNNRGLQLLRGQSDFVDNFNYTARVLFPEYPPSNSSDPVTGKYPLYLPQIFNTTGTMGGLVPFQRSQLDTTPPALYGDRLGAYMLPNCASFKVEWCLDPHSAVVGGRLDGENEVYWIDPGDEGNPNNVNQNPPNPFASLDAKIKQLQDIDADDPRAARLHSLIYDAHAGTGSQTYSLADRFRDDNEWQYPIPGNNRFNTAVFTASRLDESTTPSRIVSEDVFPKTLRITVDVFDDERRLERPIRHVMIIPVGG